MLAKKTFVLVFLLVLGSSIASGRYVEDSSKQHDDEEAEENEAEQDMDDGEEDNDFDESYGEKRDSDARHEDTTARDEEYEADGREEDESDAREEVVKIHPGQSEESEQEDEDNSEDDGERFEDGDDLNDERMMDGDEGGLSLAGHDEEESVADQEGFESFKRKADEINRENENIQREIRDLKAKFDEALNSDIAVKKAVPVLSADDAKAEIQDGTSDQSLSDMSSRTKVQHRVFSEDDVIRQYAEIGEDAYIAPDDDY